MTTNELRERLSWAWEVYHWDYDTIGVRTQDVPFALGKINHTSVVWDDGEPTDIELDGLCATMWDAPEISAHCNGCYIGEHVAIVGGRRNGYGEDAGEVILSDAVVLEIIK